MAKKKDEKGSGGGGNPNEVVLQVSVGGAPAVSVTANKNSPLHTIIPEALRESQTTGQGPDNWDIKDKPGNLLDPKQKIEEFNFPPDTILFLTLKTGEAGG
ncbi:MAG: DUF2604 domain-containing protein [Nitrospira sp.]|nr:DUF2604 domain-containing protein [Nitrospira sp.]